MKLGPFTFQCACFICSCRSTADARRRFMSAFSSDRRFSERSYSASYILGASGRLAILARLAVDLFINGFFLGWWFEKLVLSLVVKPVNPGEFAFRDQFRLGLQPMLHIASG